MVKEKDEISTRLRLPADLHHKLGVLADLDNKRSLHNYMIKALQEHVTKTERDLMTIHGEDQFDAVYKMLFGDKYDPYIFEVDILTEKLNPQIEFNATRSKIMREILNRNKMKQEAIDNYNAANKVAEESSNYNIEFNDDDDKSDNS
jgi:hypothetical protein